MTTLEILKAARELIAKPGGWCQEEYAMDANGKSVFWTDPNACTFCVLGAVNHAAGSTTLCDEYATDAAKLLNRMLGQDVPEWNDNPYRTQEEVIALYDRAIAAEEAKA